MKTINKNDFTKISLLVGFILFSASCKKDNEENKAPSPVVTTPTPTSTSDTYVIQNYNSNSFNVNDTIHLITTTSGVVKLTIPVNYAIDTMTLTFDSAFTSTTSVYSFDHQLRNNTAYRLIGNMYRNTSTTMPYFNLLFSQRIAPYGVSNSVQNYNLEYLKH